MNCRHGQQPSLLFRSVKRSLRQVSAPAVEPLHLSEAKMQGRVTDDSRDEDLQWKAYLASARLEVEKDTERGLVWQRWKLTLDAFPTDEILLEMCPVLAVESVKYLDTTGIQRTLSTDSYSVLPGEPGSIVLAYGKSWPSTRGQAGSVEVTFTAGYAAKFVVTGPTSITTYGYTPVNGDIWRVSNSGGVLPTGLAVGVDYYVVNSSGQACGLSLTPGGSAVAIGGGSGANFIGEIPENIKQAIRLRSALSFADREGADYQSCERAYWSTVNGAKWH